MQGKQVLIVEDNEDLALLQAELLKQELAGCIVYTVTTGTQAKAFLQLQMPELILLDLTIPPPDGLSLMRWLRKTAKRMPRIIVTTGCTEQCVQKEALRLGASYCMLKPYAMNDLIGTVSMLLQEPEDTSTVIDTQRRQEYIKCVKKMLGQMTNRIESEGYRFILLGAENYFDFGRSGISIKALSEKIGYVSHTLGSSNPAETAIYRLIREIETNNPPAYQILCKQFGVQQNERPTVRRFLSMLFEAALQKSNFE